MLRRLADLACSRPRRVAGLGLVLFIVVGVLGGPAPGAFNAPNAFNDPGSESTRAEQGIERATGGAASADVIALVNTPRSSGEVTRVAGLLRADPGIADVAAPPPVGPSPAVSRDGSQVLVAATLRTGAGDDTVVKRLESAFAGDHAVALGGSAVAAHQVGGQATSDLAIAELIAFPLLAILSLIVFRGVAALLPVAIGGLSVLTAFAVLRAINSVLALSPFALNLVIGAGLGLGVDYSLFLVSRFREELGRGAEVPEAVRTTMRTAGRTVLFSGVTVAAAMACLIVFPQRFLVSMGLGGLVVALVAAASSVIFLPALFMLTGRRLGKVKPGPDGSGRWYHFARAVMRRPGAVAALTAVALLAPAMPALGIRWSGVDASVLPTGKSARTVSDAIARSFPGANSTPAVLAVSAPAGAGPALHTYAAGLRRVAGVQQVPAPRYLGRNTWEIDVDGVGTPITSQAQSIVNTIRAGPAPFPVAVGGATADLLDQHAATSRALPVAIALLVVLTLGVLWLMTGSVVLPIKALLMNLLTVAATAGILVLVFQDGNLTGLLGFTKPQGIEQTDFLVLVAIVFGLSTDYGVFLLTRIKEARDRGLSDEDAIAIGMQRTGAIVTAAAILLAVALGAFMTSQLVFLKELGLGAAVAVLMDAFVVRGLLVPALMRLLGSANWWSPRPLRRLHERLDVSESTPAGA
ncbi:MAG: MMPL family transporter [Actinomycetota bacterium]|nr:MMPL family transporter [Actinomycetota bacterium]